MFSSELVAIIKALCFIEVSNEALHLILTDSLSSLLALRAFYPCNPLIQDVLSRLTALDQGGKTVKFCWISKPRRHCRQRACRCCGETRCLSALHSATAPTSTRFLSRYRILRVVPMTAIVGHSGREQTQRAQAHAQSMAIESL